MASLNFGKTEILQIIDSVAREKAIPTAAVAEAMEQAILVAARKKYGQELNIKVEIDRKTGEIKIFRILTVVEEPTDNSGEVSEAEAESWQEDAKVGDVIKIALPPIIEHGRLAAQAAKQVILQKVREAERDRQYEEFKDREKSIVYGIVKRIEYGHLTVDLNRAEALLPKDSLIKNEIFRQNDRIKAYVEEVRRESKGPQIFLSRTHPEFLVKLFEQEVPEIYDGIIQIKAVAREPGSRSKIAVFSQDTSIDAIGSCVGVRGARVQAVINELQGEKIDIIPWSSDPATFVVNALLPAEVTKVVIDEENNRIVVVVPQQQLSIAIGRRGQNVRLASQLTNLNIDVLTEEEESKQRTEAFHSSTQMFMEALNVEEMIGQLLVTEGFNSVEEIATSALSELTAIEGFDEEIAKELQDRASGYLQSQQDQKLEKIKAMHITPELIDLCDQNLELVLTLANNDVKKLSDLADLSRQELQEIVNDQMSPEQVDQLIMQARNKTH